MPDGIAVRQLERNRLNDSLRSSDAARILTVITASY